MHTSTPLDPAPETTAIIDNRVRKVENFLRREIDPGARMSVVSAYFTIYAYADLRAELDGISHLRFLYGDPRGVGAPDPTDDVAKAFRLTDAAGLELKQALTQKPLARACANWIRKRADIRTVEKINFLHGRLYHVARGAGETAALLGSSNFTRRGLGLGASPNIELNLVVRDEAERAGLLRWFDDLWHDTRLTRDAKQDVLDALERLGRNYSPEFVYYKTLFHILENRIAERQVRDGLVEAVHLHDTAVWKMLFTFQKDGAVSAINRLLTHNGCIVADSVGLGKTLTALAVIKFFELRNERVLVLCPKRLSENWIRYTSWAGYRHNPLEKDRLGYTVLAHTDLSRAKGTSGNIDLAKFNWSAFDLIVIDESHNFRNEGRDRKDDEGNIVGRSRYRRLLNEVLREGVHTKVLMLSATPVNTSLRDLRNQVYLMTEKRQDAFRESLGVGSVESLFRVAEREFRKWEEKAQKTGIRDKGALLERLGADFLALLDAVTIARSRSHIRRYYPEVEKKIGGFPERAKPKNLHPPSDSRGELSYDDLHERIGRFRLAVYMPSQYVRDTTDLDKEKAERNFDQRDREHWLVGMIRVNLLKRLESSVHSFALTMQRIIKKMGELDQRIEKWREKPGNEQFKLLDLDEGEEDEEFTLGKRRRYRLSALDLDAWRRDLQKDKETFEEILRLAEGVTVQRDAKLAQLRRVLRKKVEASPPDKDGRPNPKALIFTTFADTARYLYDNLADWVVGELGVHLALVTGSQENKTTTGGKTGFTDIIASFAPRAQQAESPEEVDILIATDCLSEGQNLQDCDLVVNYDIHWNPVRLMQRLGRIDRIGSRNDRVAMANFWPTRDLDRYLDLKNRVEARMALADAAATGQDDPFGLENGDTGKTAAARSAQIELSFRDQQLQRLREEILDIEDVDEGVSLSDFTLDDFMADLLSYLQENRKALEAAPFGILGVVPPETSPASGTTPPCNLRPGAIFCLKQKNTPDEPTPNRLHPYFLAYVRNDGNVRYTFKQAKQTLTLFSALARGRTEVLTELVDAFDQGTQHGQEMQKYEEMFAAGLRSIVGGLRKASLLGLATNRGAKLPRRSGQPASAADFELVTWLAIVETSRRA